MKIAIMMSLCIFMTANNASAEYLGRYCWQVQNGQESKACARELIPVGATVNKYHLLTLDVYSDEGGLYDMIATTQCGVLEKYKYSVLKFSGHGLVYGNYFMADIEHLYNLAVHINSMMAYQNFTTKKIMAGESPTSSITNYNISCDNPYFNHPWYPGIHPPFIQGVQP